MALCVCKATAGGVAGPSCLPVLFGNTCTPALGLVLCRDPRPVSSEGSKEQHCGISAGSETGDGKLCL